MVLTEGHSRPVLNMFRIIQSWRTMNKFMENKGFKGAIFSIGLGLNKASLGPKRIPMFSESCPVEVIPSV